MHANFKEMNQSEEDKNTLHEYAKHPQGYLLLSGTNGSGKSYAAEAIYNMNTPYRLPQYDSDRAIFITQAALNTECNSNLEERMLILDKYKNVKLLVLDDLGTRKPTEAFSDFLYDIIDFRWRNRDELATIITTNLNSKEVRTMFGDAILSRIASNMIKRWEHEDRRHIEF